MKYWISELLYFRRMSHLIQNTSQLYSEPILKTISREVIVPPVKNFKHCQSSVCQNQNEQKMLRIMFYQLKNQQYEKIHQQNAYEMRKQFQALKAKLAKKMNQQNVQRVMENQSELPKLDLSAIIKMNPLKIDLLKKHRSKIHGKLSLYRQTESIMKEKEDYHDWYDATKNNPMNSPIFTKMTYLLQKLGKKQKQTQNCGVNRSFQLQKKQRKDYQKGKNRGTTKGFSFIR